MERVKRYHPNLTIKAVVADALYGQQTFMDAASVLFNDCQVISQIRGNQNIRYRNCKHHVEDYFSSYGGWAQLAKQQGEKGVIRGLTLSLLLDHCLLLHPQQLAQIEHKHSAYTVGSLQRSIQMEALMASIQEILQQPNPLKYLSAVTQTLKELFVLNPSSKHMVGKDLGRLEPTPSLKHRAAG